MRLKSKILCLFIFYFILSNNNKAYAGSIKALPAISYSNEFKKYYRQAASSSNSDSIILYADKLINIAPVAGKSLATGYGFKGIGYQMAGDFNQALSAFLTSAEIYMTDNNSAGLGAIYCNIADLYSSMDNSTNTKKYLLKALGIFQSINDHPRYAAAMLNLGHEYYKTGQLDSALYFFNKSRKQYITLNDSTGYAYCIGNTGLVNLRQKHTELAEKQLDTAIYLLLKQNDCYAVIDFYDQFSELHRLTGNRLISRDLATIGYQLAIKNNLYEYQKVLAKRLSLIFKENKVYDSAYFYQQIYHHIKDSLKNLETIQNMANLRTEYEVSLKQNEVDDLLKKRTIQLIIIVSLALVLMLAAWLIILYRKGLARTKQYNQLLSERRQQLETQRAKLARLNNIKDKFFSIISHDLRSPLSSLNGVSILIRESVDNDNKTMLIDIADFMDQTVISFTSLLENLLNWGLNQQGKFPFYPEKINCSQMINEVVKIFTSVALAKNIKFNLALDNNLHIYGDNNSLNTVIRNLLSNAIKFTHEDGEILITAAKTSNNMVEIKVIDNGIGIPPEKQKVLFELSGNKSTRGTSSEKGVGLGLSLVYEFIEMNKGEVRVKSAVNKGTTFIIKLPSG